MQWDRRASGQRVVLRKWVADLETHSVPAGKMSQSPACERSLARRPRCAPDRLSRGTKYQNPSARKGTIAALAWGAAKNLKNIAGKLKLLVAALRESSRRNAARAVER